MRRIRLIVEVDVEDGICLSDAQRLVQRTLRAAGGDRVYLRTATVLQANVSDARRRVVARGRGEPAAAEVAVTEGG